jgi:SAM-dependent methyltransferase
MTSADWDARYAARQLVWGREANRFVQAELSSLPPGRALDLASGEGRNAVWLAARGWDVVALDFSAVATERARALAVEAGVDVDARCADVLETELPPDGFDLVLIAYLQLHRAQRLAVVRRAGGALRPGGTFLLVAHDLRNLREGYGGPSSEELLWTVEDVLIGLGDELEIERAEVVEREVEGAERPALDTLVRARRPRRSPPGTARAPSRGRAVDGDSPGR